VVLDNGAYDAQWDEAEGRLVVIPGSMLAAAKRAIPDA